MTEKKFTLTSFKSAAPPELADEPAFASEGYVLVRDAVTNEFVDFWSNCERCGVKVNPQTHRHSHVCELDDLEGCSFVSPEDLDNPQTSDLIPPVSIGDWDFSLYIVDANEGANEGRRIHRMNGEVVETDSLGKVTTHTFDSTLHPEVEMLPEIGPSKGSTQPKHRCAYCKRGFESTFYYLWAHTCKGLQQAQRWLEDAKLAEPSYAKVKKVVRTEAALTEHWSEADRNRVPSELGKLDWLNPRQD